VSTIYDNLENLVNTTVYDKFFGFGGTAFDTAMQLTQQLQTYRFTPVPVNVPFTIVGGPGSFIEPDKPTRTIRAFQIPDDVPDVEVATVQLDSVAGDPPTAPTPYVYAKPAGTPGALDVSAPGPAPTVPDITLPDERTFTVPDEPDFFTLTIPEFEGLTIPVFAGERPVIDFVPPSEHFEFTEQAYSSTLLDATKTKLAEMIQTGIGVPAEIERMIFDRARSREDDLSLQAEQEVIEDFASRGWSKPNGILSRQLQRVRQGNRAAASEINRTQAVEHFEAVRRNIVEALAQTVQLEGTLIGAHMQVQQRRFDTAKFAFEAILSIFNARITLHNAAVQAYQVDAQVYRELIQAEIAKVQAFKAQVEAQAVIGQMNETLARTYESRIRGVLALIEAYKAEFTAALSRIEVSKQQLEAHRLGVQTYSEQIRAWGLEWEGYNSRVRAELGHATAADIASRNYYTSTQAWQTKHQVGFEKLRGHISIEDLRLRKFEALMRRWLGELEGERTAVTADVAAVGAEAQVYTAAGSVARDRTAAQDRGFALAIEKGRADAQIKLQNGQINLSASLQAAGYSLQALQTAGQVGSNLAAASLSAISVSGSLRGDVSYSYRKELP
jgi:hypothetical protein